MQTSAQGFDFSDIPFHQKSHTFSTEFRSINSVGSREARARCSGWGRKSESATDTKRPTDTTPLTPYLKFDHFWRPKTLKVCFPVISLLKRFHFCFKSIVQMDSGFRPLRMVKKQLEGSQKLMIAFRPSSFATPLPVS